MEPILIEAKTRQLTGKKVKTLRLAGSVPAVVYGHGVETRSLIVDGRAFGKAYAASGDSSLVDLAIDGGSTVKVLVHDVQYDPLRDTVTHVDFRQVNMNEKLEADVVLKFVGEAPAIKTYGGILVRNMDSVTVRCLPGDLIHEFEVDLASLKNIDDTLTVADLVVPKGIEIMAKAEDMIVIVTAPISEEELAALDNKVAADVTQVKSVIEEKKAERAAAKETDEKKK